MEKIKFLDPLEDITRTMSKCEKKEFIRALNTETDVLLTQLVVALANMKRYGVVHESKDDLFKTAVANLIPYILPIE